MTLIFILISLGLDYFLGGIERFRKFDWSISLFYWLEKRFAHYRFWDSSLGLLLVLSIPMIALLSVVCLFDHWFWIAEALLTLLILIYCLAPEGLDNRLDNYITAIEEGDTDSRLQLESELIDGSIIDDADTDETAVIKSSIVEAHKRTFAVIFWFLILGVVGALLYRLVDELNDELHEIRSGFADSAKVLLNILEWPSSRVMVLGLALSGNLVGALPRWSKSEHLSFEVNNQVLINSGIGALQYSPAIEVSGREKSYWIGELKSLINRTLLIWLAILAVITLSGNLG